MNPDFARSWHEAVAIVQEVASQLAPGARVPAPGDLLLDPAGTVQFGSGAGLQQHPVAGLGLILQGLLEGIDAPPALRALADENARPSPAHASVETFQAALAFYERPARASDLQALVSRLHQNPPPPNPEGEFERLREKLVARAEVTPVPERPPASARTRQMLIAAAVILLAVVGALAVYARPGAVGAGDSLTARMEQKVADTISAGLTKLGVTAATSVTPEGTLAEAPEPAGRPARAVALPRTAGTSKTREGKGTLSPTARETPAAPADIMAATSASASLGVPGIAEMAAVAPFVEGPSIVELGGVVTYSGADRDVEPPRLNRQQLPREPKPGEDTGYFDLVVSETGVVERVQLVSPMLRFQERMLMAAAKAWTFRPALRNGEPVRYRLRMAIILSDKP
jgi:hypothetical protein